MIAQNSSAVRHLIQTFGDWLKYRRELRELRELDIASFDDIARELQVSPVDLEALARQGPHAADELPKLLTALGIDEGDLVRTEPLVLRDMERVCALCQHKGRCHRELAAGTTVEHYESYCPNASTIDSLDLRTNV
jgi:uncharacterized protein YjiS (DUF1127 family)